MDYLNIASQGVVKYTPFENKLISYFTPSTFGKPSDIEKILEIRDVLAKFDFTVVDPKPSLGVYLNSVKDKLNNCFSFDYGSLNSFEDAYNLRCNLFKNLNLLGKNLFTKTCGKAFRTEDFGERKKEISYYDKFCYSLDKILEVFPSDSKIFLYGSSVNSEIKPSDFDFRIIVPKMDFSDYEKYICSAKKLNKEEIPITFGVLGRDDFKYFQLTDNLDIFSTNKSILVKGKVPIYTSNLGTRFVLTDVLQRFVKVRKSLVKENLLEIPKIVKARRNDPYFAKNLISNVFGEKNIILEKFHEENLSREDSLNALEKANRDFARLLNCYKQDFEEFIKIKF